jgi:hypothetical protein
LSYYRQEEVWIGYVWMIAGCAAFHILAIAVYATHQGTFHAAFSATGPFSLFLIFCVAWIFGLTSGLIVVLPAFLAITLVARIFDWNGLAYYLAASIAVVLINTPLFILVAPPIYFLTSADMSFLEKWRTITPFMMASASVGGTVFWWRVGRFGSLARASSRG